MVLNISNLNWVDMLIVAVLAAGFIAGMVKGVIKQAFSLGGLAAGLVVGMLLYEPAADLLLQKIRMSETAASITAFIIILLMVPLVFTFVGEMLSRLIRAIQLGFADRLLGGLFGMVKYLLVMGLVLQLLDYTGLSDKFLRNESDKTQSRFYQPVRSMTDACLRWTWNSVMEKVPESINLNKNHE
ncbi:MAG: CvpA family protein [Bacteroidaceae bacterium]|nr:CvpA family protein [Bacteroidaceae bacterium]